MIFTVGETETYESYFEEQDQPKKGVGGSVWRTRAEVEEYLASHKPHGFSVYGVQAVWGRDTRETGFSWQELLIASPLVRFRRTRSATKISKQRRSLD